MSIRWKKDCLTRVCNLAVSLTSSKGCFVTMLGCEGVRVLAKSQSLEDNLPNIILSYTGQKNQHQHVRYLENESTSQRLPDWVSKHDYKMFTLGADELPISNLVIEGKGGQVGLLSEHDDMIAWLARLAGQIVLDEHQLRESTQRTSYANRWILN